MKVGVEDFLTVRVMRNQNPAIREDYLKSLQAGSISITLIKVYRTSSGMPFSNSFQGSRIEEIPYR